jgi:organic hydroperoxide reductase OsmC/OhrA
VNGLEKEVRDERRYTVKGATASHDDHTIASNHSRAAPDQFELQLDRRERYEFEVRFDWERAAPLLVDEPEPLGARKGPNAARLIGAAVGNCLSASLLFCLGKAKQEVRSLHTDVAGTMMRNARGRLRLARLDVRVTLDVSADRPERVQRCFELFEDYCVVTAAVRKGIPVSVVVVDPRGRELYRQDDEAREPA